MPSIEQYRMLISVADHNSLRAAAEAMHKTQPTLTNAIKKMEEELNITLFDRSSYRIKLTEAGMRVKELAIQLFEKHDQINQLAEKLSNGEEAFVSVAIEASLDLSAMLPTLKMLQEEHANCQIMLQQEYLSGAFEKLMNGDVDLAVTPIEASVFPTGEVDIKPVATGEFVNLAAHSLTAKYPRLNHIEQLRNEYQIVVKDSGSLTDDVNIGVPSGQRTWFVNNFESKKLLIESGLGWGTLPKNLVTKELSNNQLVMLELNGFPVIDEITYHLIKKKNKMLGTVADKIWQSF